MKLLWLCNMIPGPVQKAISGREGNGLWVDRVLSGIRDIPDLQLRILCPAAQEWRGVTEDGVEYATFPAAAPQEYAAAQKEFFREELSSFGPDVVHIWGTEFGHTLAMTDALEDLGMLERSVVHIQGLCYIYAKHYAEGIPHDVKHRPTFRDAVRQDNIFQQQRKFALRGENEIKALRKLPNVMGRTGWDRACTQRIHPEVKYYFCNESLRQPFYEGQWRYENCQKHRIFASSCVYPIKGFHYLLEALAEVVKSYPDVRLAVPGKSYLAHTPKEKLKQSGYQQYLEYLTRKYGLENHVEFLGNLSAEEMKEQFLRCNAFVLPSTIENSPNSLGEAMLLGVPSIASDVGGVTDMLLHKSEGYVYPSTAPYMMAHYLKHVFAQGEKMEAMGQAARIHAQKTHDPEKNLQDLLNIYKTISK